MSDNFKVRKYFSEQKWDQVNKENRDLMKEFLDSKKDLSDKTLEQYQNALQIFFLWVLDNAKNLFITELKKRDILKYQNFLLDNGLSACAIKFKRSAVSSLCNYLETFYDDVYPTFRNIIKNVPAPTGDKVHKKEPLTVEEMDLLRKELTEKEMWQQLAYLEISYDTAARREEVRQLKKEIANHTPNEKGFYATHDVRTKGRGKQGKVRKLYFSESSMNAIKKWLEVRGEDDCEYLFAVKYKSILNQVDEATFNYWCKDIFSKIINRRVHPHLLRSTRATHLTVIEGKDINSAKNLLGHISSQTTEIYVVRNEEDSLNDCF